MARLYRYPKGVTGARGEDPLAWVIARHVKVQAELQSIARRRAAIAEGVLAAHRDSGDAEIIVEHGDVDWYVTLQDHPDQWGSMNAMAIETGAENGRGGVHALGLAFPETKVYYM